MSENLTLHQMFAAHTALSLESLLCNSSERASFVLLVVKVLLIEFKFIVTDRPVIYAFMSVEVLMNTYCTHVRPAPH